MPRRFTSSGAISGAGGLTKTGPGALDLIAQATGPRSNTYTGDT